MTELQELEFDVLGKTCVSCARRVEETLGGVRGVIRAEVPSWESSLAMVRMESGVGVEQIVQAIGEAGYQASLRSRTSPESPPEVNGQQDGDFDLMIIGGGSAGFAAAIKGAELGARVALVEADTVGGTCVNWGCVPSKNLIRAVERYHLAGERRFPGVATNQKDIDWPTVVAQKDGLVSEMRQARYVDVLAAYPQITYIQGRAQLTREGEVKIDGVLYSPGRIVIAAGARPWEPPIPGLEGSGYLDSTAALDLREIPKSMIVMGGNAVGLEIAQIYARAGSAVTVVELLDRIAPFEEPEISRSLTGYLEAEGLRVITGYRTAQVQAHSSLYRLRGAQGGTSIDLEAEKLLVATGRRPNTAGLGLEAAGVRLGERGEILTDRQLQTDNPRIYAAGDVLGGDMFVYVAAHQGILAAENALTGRGRVYEGSYIPRITFTDPQIASAGLTESQAVERGYDVKTTMLGMELVASAQARRDTRGLIKLVARADTDRLLGAHILAPEAGEMIQTAVMAIRFGIP
ncbi:MAG: mercury(II) reductase, partial [Chloroflexota bacterium]